MKKILVTGASGFIGIHTLKYLTRIYDEVLAVNYNRTVPDDIDGVIWRDVNILDDDSRTEAINEFRPSHLLHFAWYAESGKYAASPVNIDWLISSLNLIREFYEKGGERAVCAGTCFEYDFTGGYCSEEKTPRMPDTIYGACKNSLFEVLTKYAEISGISFAWGRIFYLYGPYESPNRLVSSIIRSLLKDEEALCTEGLQKRDFLHVEDVARAFVKMIEGAVEGPVNIGSGAPIAIRDIALKIGALLNKEDLIKLGGRESPANEPPLIAAVNNRLTEEVKWEQKHNLESGLIDTIEWWKKNL